MSVFSGCPIAPGSLLFWEERILLLLLRVICFALTGVLSGILGIFLARRLLRDRSLVYSLSPKTEFAFCSAMALPGGAVGGYTTGWVFPVCGALLICICTAFTVTDQMHRIIPNQTVLAVLGLKLFGGLPSLFGVQGFLPFDPVQSLIGMAVCFAIFSLPGFFGKHVGAGDIKLAAAMGFFLGFEYALIGIVFMGMLVIIYSVLQRKVPFPAFLRTQIPMGPFLAAGLFFSYLFSVGTIGIL